MARSNRTLTQFAVNNLQAILQNGPSLCSSSNVAGNTEVAVVLSQAHPACAVVRLFGKEIFRLHYKAKNSNKVIGLTIQTGDFYDKDGRPSRTTRERLNGILDAMGTANLIPEGVRVYLDQEGGCKIGKKFMSMPFNSKNKLVRIFSNPERLVFFTEA